MLIAIMGDIHANVDALSAMLDAFDRLAVNKTFCTGDVVGYGAAPSECVDLLRERHIPTTLGNHDSYTVFPNDYNPSHVRPEANQVIEWTRKQLRTDQMEWLASLPMAIETEEFMLTHASCQPFPPWIYVTDERKAAMHLLFQPKRICFNGHCHVPLIATHIPGRHLELTYLHNTILPKQGNVMVGIGSVGQPRDEDPRACAILFNTVTLAVTLLRVRYDVKSAQQRILDNGLPRCLARRIEQGK
ncbi:MAG: metallophosphoesterase family protein [Victivallales bacterium]|nr:metallophosphoesterase family protein [Victivallales bacterium]